MPQTPGVMDALVHQLRDLATSLRAAEEALPDEIRGTDGTGAVAVSLGRAGDVTGIDVDSDWSAHLDPTALGTAVVEAAGVAGQERMRAMAQAPTDAPSGRRNLCRSGGRCPSSPTGWSYHRSKTSRSRRSAPCTAPPPRQVPCRPYWPTSPGPVPTGGSPSGSPQGP